MIHSTRGDPSTFKGSTPTGGVLPIHASATGKAVLTTFSDERMSEIIDETGLPQLTIVYRGLLINTGFPVARLVAAPLHFHNKLCFVILLVPLATFERLNHRVLDRRRHSIVPHHRVEF